MKKFTITATLTTVQTITKTVEGKDKSTATSRLLTQFPLKIWELSSVLKTTTR